MAEVKVAILGLERVGASFGLALKRYMQDKEAAHRFILTGHDERGYNSKTAKEMGALDTVARGPGAAIEGAHIVLITTPYRQVEGLYHTIGPDLSPGTVVLDASPLKLPSIRWAKATLPQAADVAVYLVGITPVLNPDVLYDSRLDVNEVEGARADLFERGTMVLAPAADCPSEAVDLAAEFARIVGASVHFVDPAEHDGLIAATEGLPALLSLGLFRTLAHADAWGDLRRLTNPAFGLATRHLQHHHPDDLWALLHHNRENAARYLAALIRTLDALRASLEEDTDGAGTEAALSDAVKAYEQWQTQRLSNQWEKEREAPVGTGFMELMGGALFGRRTRKKEDDE